MLLDLDYINDYTSENIDSRSYSYKVSNYKKIMIDTDSDGFIESVWLFDDRQEDHIVAWGYPKAKAEHPTIYDVTDCSCRLNTDKLIEIAEPFMEME